MANLVDEPPLESGPAPKIEPAAAAAVTGKTNEAIGPEHQLLLESAETLKSDVDQLTLRMKILGGFACVSVSIVVGTIAFLAYEVRHGNMDWNGWRTALSVIVGIFVTVGIGQLISEIFASLAKRDKSRAALAVAQLKVRLAQRLPPTDTPGKKPEYFDSLVRINIENLERYYDLVKVHTNKSFVVSIAAGAVGFLVLVSGLIAGYFTPDNKQFTAYLTAGAGLVTEFIASVFFYLYSRTVRQLKEYHDSLLDVQNILLSFKIVGDQEQGDAKLQMMMKMLTYLISQRHAEIAGNRERVTHCEWGLAQSPDWPEKR